MRYYSAKENEWEEWEEFNKLHGNVFQSKLFAAIIKKSGAKVGLIIARDDNNSVLGGVFYFLPLSGWKKIFGEMRIISGPILKETGNKDILKSLIDNAFTAD